jgi:hypothetical protein
MIAGGRCQSSGHVCFGHAALQHPDRSQEIVPPGSQGSGEVRVSKVGHVEDAGPLLLVIDALVEEVSLQTQVSDKRT